MTFKDAIRLAGREYLQRVLQEKRGNVTKAAMEAEVSRQGFYKLMRRFGLSQFAAVASDMRCSKGAKL